MERTVFVGCSLLVTGLSLLVFNRQIATAQKHLDEIFGMGSVSVRFNRITCLVVGVVMCLMGIFVLGYMADH